jgi:hypothetical protein
MSIKANSASVLEPGGAQGRAPAPIWFLPAGTRRLVAVTVIAAALGLGIVSRGLDSTPPHSDTRPLKLELDPNTAPPQVLGALPKVGPTLVREFIRAREKRPFASREDARARVRGLGSATLDVIGPYLRFERAADPRIESVAGLSELPPIRKTRTRSPKTRAAKTSTPMRPSSQLVAQAEEL